MNWIICDDWYGENIGDMDYFGIFIGIRKGRVDRRLWGQRFFGWEIFIWTYETGCPARRWCCPWGGNVVLMDNLSLLLYDCVLTDLFIYSTTYSLSFYLDSTQRTASDKYFSLRRLHKTFFIWSFIINILLWSSKLPKYLLFSIDLFDMMRTTLLQPIFVFTDAMAFVFHPIPNTKPFFIRKTDISPKLFHRHCHCRSNDMRTFYILVLTRTSRLSWFLGDEKAWLWTFVAWAS